jgi:hypothetical protein
MLNGVLGVYNHVRRQYGNSLLFPGDDDLPPKLRRKEESNYLSLYSLTADWMY